MLHIIYILAFTVIAFIAISNLIHSLLTLSTESNRRYQSGGKSSAVGRGPLGNFDSSGPTSVQHPELLDEDGKPVNEPLLVMRSVSVEDTREQLDAIYNASPSKTRETDEEA